MPTFETPDPILAAIELIVGDVNISAGDRPDTVVEVRPSDTAKRADVNAAEQTRVEYSGGRLLVKATGRWRSWSPFGYGGSVAVTIELPADSRVTGASSLGTFRCIGQLGDCRLKTVGEIRLERARAVKLVTAAGDIALERAMGDAELITGSGDVRAEAIDGAALIKSSNGDVRVGEITGELSVKSANGDIAIERSSATVVAKTANGEIRVGVAGRGSVVAGRGSVVAGRGSVVAETGFGGIEIAILDGTAAWLDLHTSYGQLDNALDATEPPPSGADTVQVRARTGYGDIAIRRRGPSVYVDSVG